MKPLTFENNIVLLDGGMGRELRFRGVAVPETIWSAAALMSDPEVVRQVHLDFIAAGADVITTNTYGVIREDLAKEGIEDRFAELNNLACRLAVEARDISNRRVAIAGSLPPLRGSYRPDRVGPEAVIESLYREQAELLAPAVDLLLCETMSSAVEGRAAARAACQTGVGVLDPARRPVGQAAQRGNRWPGDRRPAGSACQRLSGELLRAGKHYPRHAVAGGAGDRMVRRVC